MSTRSELAAKQRYDKKFHYLNQISDYENEAQNLEQKEAYYIKRVTETQQKENEAYEEFRNLYSGAMEKRHQRSRTSLHELNGSRDFK